jgi:hypothetical protein
VEALIRTSRVVHPLYKWALSIFGTIIGHAAPPEPGANRHDRLTLAALSRELPAPFVLR